MAAAGSTMAIRRNNNSSTTHTTRLQGALAVAPLTDTAVAMTSVAAGTMATVASLAAVAVAMLHLPPSWVSTLLACLVAQAPAAAAYTNSRAITDLFLKAGAGIIAVITWECTTITRRPRPRMAE